MADEVLRELRIMRGELQNNKEELKNIIESQVLTITNQFKSFKDYVTTDLSNLKETNNELNRRIINLERQARSKNIVIYGLEENTLANLKQAVIIFITTVLGVLVKDDDIEAVYKLQSYGDNRICPILLKLTSHGVKSTIFSNCYKLKNCKKPISISEDLSKEDRQIRKQLLPHYRNAKVKGLKAHIKYDKLIINNKAWALHELNSLDLNELSSNCSHNNPNIGENSRHRAEATHQVDYGSVLSVQPQLIDPTTYAGLNGIATGTTQNLAQDQVSCVLDARNQYMLPAPPSNVSTYTSVSRSSPQSNSTTTHSSNIADAKNNGAIPKKFINRPQTRRAAQNTFL